MHRHLLPVFLSLSVLLHAFTTTHALSFTFTTIDGPSATRTNAFGINTAGQIVGTFIDATTGATHGFLKDGDTFTAIDVPGASSTAARGINSAGQIVGTFVDAAGVTHGFLQAGGTFTTIDVPGTTFLIANGIDPAGQTVGTFAEPAERFHGFLRAGGTFTTIDAPGASFTAALGINTAGQIVGTFGDTTGGLHGFVATPRQELASLGSATLWIGLKNSDDQGTRFDLQAEVAINSTPVATASTLCIAGVTRNPNMAKEVMVLFDSFLPVSVDPGDVLSLTISTRIGTNRDGTKCPGHNNAVGLRLYYDSRHQPSGIGAELTPDPLTAFFLHASGSDVLDDRAPTATTATFKDSAGLNFAGGNPWKAIGTWSLTLP